MDGFFDSVIKALPTIKTVVQYGIAMLTLLVYLVLSASETTPPMALIFIFAVVPLLIGMVFIGKLTPVFQFVIVLTIVLMATAFLGTGIALASLDKTAAYDDRYHVDISPTETRLNEHFLLKNEAAIAASSGYPEYRGIILKADDSPSNTTLAIDKVLSFYNDYLQCRHRLQCSPSEVHDNRITNFWYSYRPLIENQRLRLGGPGYGKQLQKIAEKRLPPMYASAVIRDASGELVLQSGEPRR